MPTSARTGRTGWTSRDSGTRPSVSRTPPCGRRTASSRGRCCGPSGTMPGVVGRINGRKRCTWWAPERFSRSALTIGFARRFATYKRASLIFRDLDRLQRLLANPWRPVQLVFSGKAHPADEPGKQMLKSVYALTREARFEGRIAFLEDYEMHLAHNLVQGVDLWLNVPRAPLEASGTSGMKAALNGVPQLGTLDGWWAEGYDGRNGWAIPAAPDGADVDAADAEQLYRLLEEEVVPLFYERDARGVPLGWVDKMKHALRVAGGHFTARRMVQQYVTDYYVPAIQGQLAGDDPPAA